MKITVLILSGAQGAVLVLEISDFRHMPWVLTCFIILIDYTANKINLCFINLCFIIDILPNVLIDGERAKQESCQGTGQCKEMHICLELEAELLVWLKC